MESLWIHSALNPGSATPLRHTSPCFSQPFTQSAAAALLADGAQRAGQQPRRPIRAGGQAGRSGVVARDQDAQTHRTTNTVGTMSHMPPGESHATWPQMPDMAHASQQSY